jgi:hypothetical protein
MRAVALETYDDLQVRYKFFRISAKDVIELRQELFFCFL